MGTSNPRFQGGVRSVAVFEATKGILVLLAGFGVLALLHRDAGAIVAELVGRLHLNPSRRYPSIFIDAASRLTDRRLWGLAALAMLYSSVRFLEAYGLWRRRSWAEWFALLSGCIYLPVEVFELVERTTWIRVGAVVANLLVVVFMGSVMIRSRGAGPPAPAVQPATECGG